jgi:hypothetical protein
MPQTALLRLEADRGFESHLAKPDTKVQLRILAVLDLSQDGIKASGGKAVAPSVLVAA